MTGSPQMDRPWGSTMSEEDVIEMIMVAARDGIWQNAPRGTLLSIYEVPQEEAERTGVTEVKVSIAPDGRILSAYPSAGPNVLALREVQPQENPLDVAAERKQARMAEQPPQRPAAAVADDGWTA